MGLFAKLRGELVDIVEWIDETNHTLVWRFPRHHNQIKNGARLTVRPGQVALFVNEGRIADVFEPGMYTLETANLPILSTLQGWKHGFDSPFRAEVYFVSTRVITDLKWGTPNPVMLRDPEFGPIRLRAFGSYTLRAMDPRALLRELVGTDGVFETDELQTLMRGVIGTAFAEVIGTAQIPALDLAARYQEIGEALRQAVVERIDDEYGLDVPQIFVVNISLPEQVEKALDARASMGVIGDLGRYQHYQMGQAMTLAAESPAGGPAADAMGLGVGLALASRMAPIQAVGGPAAAGLAPAPAAPPPLPAPATWHVASNGQSYGPCSPEQIAQWIGAGRISAATMVWTQGMPAWQAAGEVSELAAYFRAAPPPAPPAPPAGPAV